MDYSYDYLGNVATMLYPTAVESLEYQYNHLGQLTGIPGFIEGLPGNPGIVYDRGLPRTVRYANGVELAYTYDRNGRLDTRMDTHDGTQLFSLDLNYDLNSNIIARTVNGHTNTYTYDDLNQLQTAAVHAHLPELVRPADYGLGTVIEDYAGTKTVVEEIDDFVVDLDYAATSLGVIFNGLTERISRIELTPAEPANRLNDRRYLDVYYQDGTGYHKLDPLAWEFGLDGQTGRIVITFPDLLTAYEVRIHCRFDDRDAGYQPVLRNGTNSEFHNLAQAMVKVYRVYDYRNESYMYDANGNRTTETITTLYPKTFDYSYYNNTDRLKTRISTDGEMRWAFVYDNNGNLVKKGNTFTASRETVDFTTSGEGVIYWEYDYDVFNRLMAVRKKGTETSRYVYDPVGLRIYKDRIKEVLYDYDLGGNVICETEVSADPDVVRSYVWIGGRHLARMDGKIGDTDAPKYFYETDHLGSPVVVTGQSSEPDEIVVWRGDFTPFGEKIKGDIESEIYIDTHGFTGKDWDEDVGLYYFNARWYDPIYGSFVEADLAPSKLNNPITHNRYVYCGNNPLLYVDPTGYEFTLGPMSLDDPLRFDSWLSDFLYIPIPYPKAGFELPNLFESIFGNIEDWASGDWYQSVLQFSTPSKFIEFGADVAFNYAINEINPEIDRVTAVRINRAIAMWDMRFDRSTPNSASKLTREIIGWGTNFWEIDRSREAVMLNIESAIANSGIDALKFLGDKALFRGFPVLQATINARFPHYDRGDIIWTIGVLYVQTENMSMQLVVPEFRSPLSLFNYEIANNVYLMTIELQLSDDGIIKEAFWTIQEYYCLSILREWVPGAFFQISSYTR